MHMNKANCNLLEYNYQSRSIPVSSFDVRPRNSSQNLKISLRSKHFGFLGRGGGGVILKVLGANLFELLFQDMIKSISKNKSSITDGNAL